MYRGSSFLLQKDYTVHIQVVLEILNKRYDRLLGISCGDMFKGDNVFVLMNLYNEIEKKYDIIRKKVKGEGLKERVSQVLITKVLLGTLGCVPAYDKYFVRGITIEKVAQGIFGEESLRRLVDFYEENDNKPKLEQLRKSFEKDNLEYPQMKLLDMGFWKMGYDYENPDKPRIIPFG